mgnify:FL=1
MNEAVELIETKEKYKSNKNVLLNTNVRSETSIIIYQAIKRIIDIFGALLGCILLIPMSIIIKIISIINKDYNSIFYLQERIGKDGKIFKLIKYRTMILNADEKLEELMSCDTKIANEYKKYKKLDNDPRITKIGNYLRKSSVDEFPQFINILFNQMSLVGPRPYLEREKKDMGKSYKEIIKVKPGLTGLWQVRGRSNTDFKDRLTLDKEYIKNRSMLLDTKIFFKTFNVVSKKEGAK